MVQFSSQRYRSSTATRWLKSDRATAEKALVMNPNTTVPAPQFLIWFTSANAQGLDLLITICSLQFLNLQRLLWLWYKTLWHFLMGYVAQLPFAPQTGWGGTMSTFQTLPHCASHLVFAIAPMKPIRAARKGGGSLFLDCTRKTAAVFSQHRRALTGQREACLIASKFSHWGVSTIQVSPCANLQLMCTDERNSRASWRKPELFLFLVE